MGYGVATCGLLQRRPAPPRPPKLTVGSQSHGTDISAMYAFCSSVEKLNADKNKPAILYHFSYPKQGTANSLKYLPNLTCVADLNICTSGDWDSITGSSDDLIKWAKDHYLTGCDYMRHIARSFFLSEPEYWWIQYLRNQSSSPGVLKS